MHNSFVAELIRRFPNKKVEFVNEVLRRLGRSSRLVPPTTEMASVEARMNIFHLATGVLEFGVPGDFVELGCNDGETSMMLTRIIQHYDKTRTLHVYDSFRGAPDPHEKDEGNYQRGDMAVPQYALTKNFEAAKLPIPEIHAGWFEETLPDGLPDRVAYAEIDADLYESTMTALKYVYPKMVRRGVIVFNPYCDVEVAQPRTKIAGYLSPGVKKACDEYLTGKPEKVSVLYAGDYTMGYIRKN